MNPFTTEKGRLYVISSVNALPINIERDVLDAERLGSNATDAFIHDRLKKNDKFLEPFKKLNLKTMSEMRLHKIKKKPIKESFCTACMQQIMIETVHILKVQSVTYFGFCYIIVPPLTKSILRAHSFRGVALLWKKINIKLF